MSASAGLPALSQSLVSLSAVTGASKASARGLFQLQPRGLRGLWGLPVPSPPLPSITGISRVFLISWLLCLSDHFVLCTLTRLIAITRRTVSLAAPHPLLGPPRPAPRLQLGQLRLRPPRSPPPLGHPRPPRGVVFPTGVRVALFLSCVQVGPVTHLRAVWIPIWYLNLNLGADLKHPNIWVSSNSAVGGPELLDTLMYQSFYTRYTRAHEHTSTRREYAKILNPRGEPPFIFILGATSEFLCF